MDSNSILQLDEDCLYLIFQKLDSSSDRESFGLTCHRLLHIQNASRRTLQFQCSFTQLSILSLSQPSTKIISVHVSKLLSRFTQLHSLSLSGCTELPDAGLSALLSYGSKLQSLNLDCCFDITDQGMSFIATGCPCLVLISLYRCNITDIGLETLAKSCTGLKDVNLSHCILVSDHGIREIFRNCPRLQAINISHCKNVTGIGFQGCSQALTYLEAESCKLERDGISVIFSGGGLEYLNISSLSWCMSGHGLTGIDARFLSKLKVINFWNCRTIGDEGVMVIAKGCVLLKEWNLTMCNAIGVAGWESVGLNCRNLERLHLNRNRTLCDRGLLAIRDGCKRLKVLYFSHCGNVSWAAFEMFKCLRGNVKIIYEERICVRPDWVLV